MRRESPGRNIIVLPGPYNHNPIRLKGGNVFIAPRKKCRCVWPLNEIGSMASWNKTEKVYNFDAGKLRSKFLKKVPQRK